ncbi:HAMP domain-containing protein [Elioraea sp. Yellowstone]|jgi:signal transduction histidine kinase|uniref:ATP-binding protein n=1 Tax=Elioraea sp. Yellowstone TaxID=2592070 RepID=UPI0011507385|nr:ATP-binding protein [Elioraea sp. Yellowstone]TQF85214.1 HAMP domain-containing protein [Elioraea sp. Yellowstone]
MIRRVATRLWPDTLAARVVLVLLAGLTLFHLGSLWLHQADTETALAATQEALLSEQIAGASRAIMSVPVDRRAELARALSTPNLDLRWAAERALPIAAPADRRIAGFAARLQAVLAGGQGVQVSLGPASGDEVRRVFGPGRSDAIAGAIALADGSWLNLRVVRGASAGASQHASLLSTTAMAGGILIVGLLVVRTLNRPLRQLAEAANRIATPAAPPAVLPEEGPREVRSAVQAFNRMQARIDRLITDRTQALAAVSHDLRTPIARLRLRAGFLEDAETQHAIDADLDEMEAMIDATLAYLRGETESEPRRPADLAAILETLCDAAADAGHSVRWTGPRQARLVCRPIALKRAFANLIDNAVKYGGGARVSLDADAAAMTVRVEDDGPGIPEEALEAVFEPFRRLEDSRNRGTGGSGLGLTIARQVAEAHGGTLVLENRAGGGLAATVRLPRSSPAGDPVPC